MPKSSSVVALALVILSTSLASAQSVCRAGITSDKLICLIPQVFGPDGLVLPAGPSEFQSGFAGNSLVPLNSAIARQSVLLPLASPSSGLTFVLSKDGIPVPSTDSLGPIYAERAETIGQRKAFVGVDYQYLNFTSLDGISLKNLPEVFTQPDNSVNAPPGRTCSAAVNGFNTGPCAFIRDVVKVNNRVDLKIHEFITFVTYGLTHRIDVSLAVPITNVRMGILSDATIVDVSATHVHAFAPRTGCGTPTTNCLNQQFSSVRNASGIGDMTLRVKGTAWKGEQAALAIGLDVRVPTGDSLNFLGAGAAGVKPFVVWSYKTKATFSYHLNAGFEVNGSSLIAGDISTGTNDRLPSQLTYAAGADVRISKRVTAVFDLVGQQVFEAQRLSQKTFTELGACTPNPDPLSPPRCPIGTGPSNIGNMDPNLTQTAGTFNVSNISVGLKLRPFSNLLITGNALIKVNDGGLRSSVVPLGGVSYTF
ncbi:MAG TPA: transporter [Candidatus Angelobacter sp.]